MHSRRSVMSDLFLGPVPLLNPVATSPGWERVLPEVLRTGYPHAASSSSAPSGHQPELGV